MIDRRRFVLSFAVAIAARPAFASGKLTVFAAASLKTALDAVNAARENRAVISYAASSALAKQIEEGAPADVFISADLDWMTYLAERKLIAPESEVRLLGNALVLVAPRELNVEAKIAPGFPLKDLLGGGKLAMADVKSVPAGKYGKAALETLGVWSGVEGQVAMAENVRAALKLVSLGEAALGIVYRSDALADGTVRVLDVFPADSHPPIVYPAAAMTASAHPDARAFLRFLQSDTAKAIFEAQGFTHLPRADG